MWKGHQHHRVHPLQAIPSISNNETFPIDVTSMAVPVVAVPITWQNYNTYVIHHASIHILETSHMYQNTHLLNTSDMHQDTYLVHETCIKHVLGT